MKSSTKSPGSRTIEPDQPDKGERIAKRMARAGLCSRRDAERWIEAGRVKLNGKKLSTPAVIVKSGDKIEVDDQPLPAMERTRLWLFNKKPGTMTTNKDPEGRKTIYDDLPETMPRVLSIGRLDISTEGLLLLTNDGGLARILELPATGWLRRYRVRAHGKVTQAQLDTLKDGVAVDGILYGPIEAILDREQGHNCWLTVAFREGKNREVKKVMASLGLEVNRLIRLSYGPFQLADLEPGAVREIQGRTLRDQLGARLIEQAGANFNAPVINRPEVEPTPVKSSSHKNTPKKKAKLTREEILSRLDTKKPSEPDKSGKKAKGPRKNRSGRHSLKKRASRADRRR